MALNIFNSKFRLRSSLLVGIVIVGVILLVVWRGAHRAHAQTAEADESTEPTAGVAKVTREDLYQLVTIPGEFRPYVEVELHAKVTGYVSKMNVDFGDRVKAGQIMATLEVPELQDELDNARATEQKAEADYTNANLIHTRLEAVNHDQPHLVAQQDLDTATANEQTASAAISAAKANVEKFETMVGYTQIIAPFDGVVTHRYADPGTLIQAGTASGAQAQPLVRVSDNYRLRLDFPVSVDYVKDIHLGDPVEVRVDSLDGKSFTGKVSRFTHDVNEETRTMTTELEVTNPDLVLTPGMYASVMLKVDRRSQVLTIPTEAVVSEKNPVVYLINRDDQVEERPVKLGVEMPGKYEVLSGLSEGDLVVVGSRSGLQAGQKVEPKVILLPDEN